MNQALNHTLPPLRLLITFAAVCRTGSIQFTAAELNVTQPAVSQAVKQLETNLGVQLLDRSRRPAKPTPAGQLLAEAITSGLDRIALTVEQIKAEAQQNWKAVTIACSVGVATYWLMPLLGHFYEAHPDLSVNVITTQLGAPDLAEGIDLAIRYGHGRWADGAVVKLFDEVIEPVCAPSLLAVLGAPLRAESAPLLHVRSPESSWMNWADYGRRAKLNTAGERGQIFTNYVQATQAALAGRGVMLGWRSITGALVASGQLAIAGMPRVRPQDAFYLVARPKRAGNAAEVFAAWLVANAVRADG